MEWRDFQEPRGGTAIGTGEMDQNVDRQIETDYYPAWLKRGTYGIYFNK